MKKIKFFNYSKKQFFCFYFLMILIVLFSSCADPVDIQDCTQTDPYGFFSGLWHGLISFFSFWGSLLWDSIEMYGKNNNGGWYDFGFVLGAGMFFGGGGNAS